MDSTIPTIITIIMHSCKIATWPGVVPQNMKEVLVEQISWPTNLNFIKKQQKKTTGRLARKLPIKSDATKLWDNDYQDCKTAIKELRCIELVDSRKTRTKSNSKKPKSKLEKMCYLLRLIPVLLSSKAPGEKEPSPGEFLRDCPKSYRSGSHGEKKTYCNEIY